MADEDIYAQDQYPTEAVIGDNYENDHENEPSIYETSAPSYSSIPEQTTKNFTFSPSDKKLCFIGNDLDHLPAEMIYDFGLKTLILDISFNEMSDLRDLEQFPHLEELICDNNLISEETEFPKLNRLKLFSCNKNNIKNIHIFIDKIKVKFPNLTYLSMLGNIACPNQLVDPNKDEYDYSRYRKYVLHRLKFLKFLDSYEVTAIEREIVSKESLFYDVVSLKVPENNKNISISPDKNSAYTPLPSKNQNGVEEEVIPQSSFGECKYTYHGKQSEGNRFIRNDDL